MSSDWCSLSFADLMERGALEIGDGYRAKNDELGGTGLIFLRAGHVKDTHIDFEGVDRFRHTDCGRFGRKIARAGDVVITTKGNSTGRVAYVGVGMPGFVYSPHLSYWRANAESEVDQGFLRAWSQSKEFLDQLDSLSRSTDMAPYLSLSDQRRLRITLPPVATQRAVAKLNDEIHDRIALLRETNVTLEAIGQALFKSWFVDFDPVRAKRQGLPPAGMDEATAALFPDSFEESASGLSPRGWRVEPVGQVVEGIYDGPHATPPEADVGPVFLGIKNLTGSGLDFAEVRHIAEADFAQWTRRVEPQAGDIVFSYEATLGFFALVPPGLRCCLGRRLALVRPRGGGADGHFLFHQFIAAPFQRLLERHTIQGATVNRIALKQFPTYPVLNPPDGLKAAFDSVVAPLWARIQESQAQARTLAALRDTLLPRLISGQLRLPQPEPATFEAAPA